MEESTIDKQNWTPRMDRAVAEALPWMRYLHEEPLARYTSFRVGGPARRMAFPAGRDELVTLLALCTREGVAPLLLGNGTNVLVSDAGVDTLVIRIGEGMDHITAHGDGTLVAEAGVSLARLGVFAWQEGLSDFEFAHGIPGSLGGGVVMNAGAYGGELKDVLVEVTAWFPNGVRTLRAEELELGYRHSIFTEQPEAVILSAAIRLRAGERDEIKARMDDLAARRKASQPLEYPSAGSTFKRPEGHYAGALIEQCGLKGARIGGAEVSRKHAGFIINTGEATAQDVLSLIEYVQKTVLEQTGVTLEPEVKII